MTTKVELIKMKNYILGINIVYWICTSPSFSLTQPIKKDFKQKIEADSSISKNMEEKLLNPSFNHYLNGVKRVFTTKHNLMYLATGTFTSLIVWPHDQEISQDLKDDNFKEFELQAPAKFGDFFALAGMSVFTHLIGRALKKPYLANTGLYLIEAFLTTQFITFVTKESVHRTRPDKSNNLSFPSGHTSGIFTLASVLDVRYGYKAGIPSYLLASFVGLSRVKLYKHYPTDVIAGAALGIIIGRSFAQTRGEKNGVAVYPIYNLNYVGFNFQMRF